jgi:hypothetical protein
MSNYYIAALAVDAGVPFIRLDLIHTEKDHVFTTAEWARQEGDLLSHFVLLRVLFSTIKEYNALLVMSSGSDKRSAKSPTLAGLFGVAG